MKYTVVKGDTLYNIAARYGVSVDELLKANLGIKDPSIIYPGQIIEIPAASADNQQGTLFPGYGAGFGPGFIYGVQGRAPRFPGLSQETIRSLPMDAKLGDKGKHIYYLQERLKDLGYYKGNINGRFDRRTQAAVKKLQKDCNIEQTGIVDRNLWVTIGVYQK